MLAREFRSSRAPRIFAVALVALIMVLLQTGCAAILDDGSYYGGYGAYKTVGACPNGMVPRPGAGGGCYAPPAGYHQPQGQGGHQGGQPQFSQQVQLHPVYAQARLEGLLGIKPNPCSFAGNLLEVGKLVGLGAVLGVIAGDSRDAAGIGAAVGGLAGVNSAGLSCRNWQAQVRFAEQQLSNALTDFEAKNQCRFKGLEELGRVVVQTRECEGTQAYRVPVPQPGWVTK